MPSARTASAPPPAARTELRRLDLPYRVRGPQGSTFPDAAAQPGDRLASVDALRGFCMIWILGGDGLARSFAMMAREGGPMLSAAGEFIERQFGHPPWEGFTFYDLIFPLFIFVTGVSIVLSLTKLVAREGRAKAHMRVLRRSLLLFGLGVLFYGGLQVAWPDVRLLGVLQRIALCYLFASLLFLNLGVKGLAVAFAALLLGYWALLTLVPVPGLGAPSLAYGETLANSGRPAVSARAQMVRKLGPGRFAQHAAGHCHLPAGRVRGPCLSIRASVRHAR